MSRGDLFPRRGRLDHDEAGQARVRGEQVEARAERRLDPVGQARARVALKGEDAEQPFLGDLVGRGEAVSLVGELLVERVAADLAELDDVLHGRPLEAVLGNRVRQRHQHPATLIGGDGSAEIA